MRWKPGKEPMRMSSWLLAIVPYLEQGAVYKDAVADYGCESFTWVTFMRRRDGVGPRSRPRVCRR